MFDTNISEILKYENAETIQRNINIASVLCKNSPNCIHLVNIYIDINSSLLAMKGNSAKSVTAENSKNSPEIVIDIMAILGKSFFSFKNGNINKKYISAPYANRFCEPCRKVLCKSSPKIGVNLFKL